MTTFLIILSVIFITALLLTFWVTTYNSFVKMSVWIDESWAQIDVQLKRRYDLIPNLVETVKGYINHERETLESVIKARNSIANNNNNFSREEVMKKNEQLSGALKSIFALSEDYPELKSNENFTALSEEITNTENKISYARQLYNTTVASYNTKARTIPFNFIARIHNFSNKPMLEAKSEERENVKVSF